MREVTLSAPLATGVSAVCILDQYLTPANTLLAVEFAAGASATSQVEYTASPPYSTDGNSINPNAVWFIHPVLIGLTASGVDQLSVPATAVRLNNTAWASGQVILRVVQAGLTG